MDEREFEAAQDALELVEGIASMCARLRFNGAPDDLCERAEATLRLAVRVLDDVGVFTELEAIKGMAKRWHEAGRPQT